MIATRRLRVVFGQTVALDGIDLDLDGGIVGLFGPNGSGKSTLLRALVGLITPAAGTISLDGVAVSLRDEAFRRRVGYSGHTPGLYGRLTVRENVDLFAGLYGAKSRTDEVLRSLGLEERARTRVEGLSAGFARRASVARALVHDPDVLLLDEPYANLDDDAAETVSRTLREWRRPGKLGVIATHGAKRVRAFADAGIVLRRGSVASYRSSFAVEAQ